MAKTKATKATSKSGDALVTSGPLKGYTKCGVCGRKMKDIAGHRADHKSNKINAAGRRTGRSREERLAFALRFNGRKATARAKGLDAEDRVKRFGRAEAKRLLAS